VSKSFPDQNMQPNGSCKRFVAWSTNPNWFLCNYMTAIQCVMPITVYLRYFNLGHSWPSYENH